MLVNATASHRFAIKVFSGGVGTKYFHGGKNKVFSRRVGTNFRAKTRSRGRSSSCAPGHSRGGIVAERQPQRNEGADRAQRRVRQDPPGSPIGRKWGDVHERYHRSSLILFVVAAVAIILLQARAIDDLRKRTRRLGRIEAKLDLLMRHAGIEFAPYQGLLAPVGGTEDRAAVGDELGASSPKKQRYSNGQPH